MKQIIRHRLILGLLLFTALFSIIPSRAFAVAGTIYFYPGSNSVIEGNSFTVEIRGNVPRPLWSGGATIGVTYPTSLLQATSATSSGGALGGSNPTINNGTVNFSVFNFWGVAVNNQMIFKVTFKAIATGNATLNFTSNTNINDGPTTKNPSTYSIQAATCPAGQVGTPPNCTTPPPSPSPKPSPTPSATPKPSTTPKPSPTPTPIISSAPSPTFAPTVEETPAPIAESDGGLKIENVKIITNRQKNSVTWSLNRANITPTVIYGTSKDDMKSKADVTKLGDGSYEVVFTSLKPGTLYYFGIKAVSSDNLQGANYSGTLTTRGYPVQLTIQQNGVLAPSAKVTIGSRNFVANKDAIITTELGEGNFDATITPVGSSKSLVVKFAVAEKRIPSSGNPALQSFTLNAIIDDASSGPDDTTAYLIIGGVIAGIFGIGGIIGFIIYRRRQNQDDNVNASVDEDLLIANYGSAIESYRNNTPAPNIEATANLAPAQVSYAEPITPPPDPAQPPADIPLATPPEQPMTSPGFDPAALPLPPEPVTEVIPPQTPTTYSEEEQTTAELVQIESEQVPEDATEPSAIYDAATGELDIIHHHAEIPQNIEELTDSPLIGQSPALQAEYTPPAEPPAQNQSIASVTPQQGY